MHILKHTLDHFLMYFPINIELLLKAILLFLFVFKNKLFSLHAFCKTFLNFHNFYNFPPPLGSFYQHLSGCFLEEYLVIIDTCGGFPVLE